MGMKDWG